MIDIALERYIGLHLSLGFRFRTQSNLLRSFVRYSLAHGEQFIRTGRALEWAVLAPTAPTRRNRLLTVRRFALALRSEDQRHQVPAAGLLGPQAPRRRCVHIYSEQEVADLMAAAAAMGPIGSIKPKTYSTLFGLLAATGLRISEALALKLGDITPDGLVVRKTKFAKSRIVPLHRSTSRVLERYLFDRAKLAAIDDRLFIAETGQALAYPTVVSTFLRLTRAIGLRGPPGQSGPRIHDLRHTFAVRSLEACPPDRNAVARHIAALSTYLGHAHVTDTYWYLQSTPLLMTGIADANEAFQGGGAR